MCRRIFNYHKCNKLSQKIIKIELTIYDKFNSYVNNEFSLIKQLFDNLLDNYTNTTMIKNCKLSFVNNLGIQQEIDTTDIDKVNYNIFNENIYKNEEIILLNHDKIPNEIQKYFKIGQTYYKKAFEIFNINWDIEHSIINININQINIICNIIQYTLLYYIINHNYTIDELIDYVINDKKKPEQINALKSYISNLLSINIVLMKKYYIY